jgi:phosphoserine phosphatase
MAKTRKTKVALIYDFDGTLSPGNMQEHTFIPQLNVDSSKFWNEAKRIAKEQEADEILAYMHLMLKEADKSEIKIDKKSFKESGKNIPFFNGVNEWFDRINEYGNNIDLNIEQYIISSGIKEMIEGSPISNKFKKIYASSFLYDQYNKAISPGVGINYTTKTQYLFRINKGLLDIWDNLEINKYIPEDERDIPFRNMIYIGDGSTDVPCMKLVKERGGHSLAVYKPKSRKKAKADELINENRVNFVSPANYSAGTRLDKIIKTILRKIAVDNEINKIPKTN